MEECTNDFLENLEKNWLFCAICRDTLQDPITLECLHSFCHCCIERLKAETSDERHLKCPTCRQNIDVSKLRSSFFIKSLIEFLHKTRSTVREQDDQLPTCVSCSKKLILVAFCPQCNGLICPRCLNAHNEMKKLRDEHHATMLTDFKQEHLNSYIMSQAHCEEKFHTEYKLEYFCLKCQKVICPKCSNTAHDGHAKISVEDKAEEVKRSINEELDQINQLKEEFVEELNHSEQNIESLENEVNAAKKKLSDHVKVLIMILQERETAALKSLDEIFQQRKAENDEEQNEIKTVIQNLDGATDQCRSLLDQQVVHFLLQSHLPQRCKELLLRSSSVLQSKPSKRHASVYYIPNTQVTQSVQDLGKIIISETDSSRCSIELLNDAIRCGFANQFAIVTRDSAGEICYTGIDSIDVKVIDDDGFEVEHELLENKTGTFIMTYKAVKPVPYQILARVSGKTIYNSPVKVKTFDAEREFKPITIFEQRDSTPFSLAVSDSQELAAIVERDKCDECSIFLDNMIVKIISMGNGKRLRRIVKNHVTGDGEVYYPVGVLMYKDRIVVSANIYRHIQSGSVKVVGMIQEFDINGAYLKTIYKQEGVEVCRMCTTGDNISVLSHWELADGKQQAAIKVLNKHSGHLIIDIYICAVEAELGERKYLPDYIAYDNNKYFLSYTFKNHISVFDDNGVFLYNIGEEGEGNGQFNGVAGLAVFGDRLLVCDGDNHRIQVFTQDGEFVTSFGFYGSGLGQMKGPIDVAVTSDGKIFVLETDGNRLQLWQ